MEPSTRQYLAQLLMGAGQGITQASQGRPAGMPGPSFAGMLGGASTGIAAQMQRYKQEQLMAENARREQDRFEQRLALQQQTADQTGAYQEGTLNAAKAKAEALTARNKFKDKRDLRKEQRAKDQWDATHSLSRDQFNNTVYNQRRQRKEADDDDAENLRRWEAERLDTKPMTFTPFGGGSARTVNVRKDGSAYDSKGDQVDITGGTLGNTPTTVRQGGLPKNFTAERNESAIQIQSAFKQSNKMLRLLNQSPDSANWAGSVASVYNDVTSSLGGLSRQLGIADTVNLYEAPDVDATFEKLGIQNQQLKAGLSALTYQAAIMEQGRKSLSNFDVNQKLQQAGATSRHPETIANNLKQMIANGLDVENMRRKANGMPPLSGPDFEFVSFSQQPSADAPQGLPIPAGLTAGQWDSLTDENQDFWNDYSPEAKKAALRAGGYTP